MAEEETNNTRDEEVGTTSRSTTRISFAGLADLPRLEDGLENSGSLVDGNNQVSPQEQQERPMIEWNQLDNSSTYAALSSACRLLVEVGYGQMDFIPAAVLDVLQTEFEARKIDLSNVTTGFPYDAEDLDHVVLLLARLQNHVSLMGAVYTSCTLKDIMEDALLDRSNKTHRYDIGEWMEVLGPSMKYRLEMIVDVVRTNADDGEGDALTYETSVDHKLTQADIRWPSEALRRIFGMRPWVWQQWACLKLEHKIRFQEGHAADLELIDIRAYAMELWELWLADERNADFRALYNRVGPSGQFELEHHIMAPFRSMHNVVTNANGQWQLDGAGISMFTYVSLLGSGFLDATIVFAIQVSIPIILFFFYTSPAREEEEIKVGTRPMLCAVLVYYLYKLNRGTSFTCRKSFPSAVARRTHT